MRDDGDDAELAIWVIDLDVDDPLFAARTAVLDAAEQDRCRRFLYAGDARRWSLARAALRRVLSEYTRTPPGDLRFELEANGRPRLASPSVDCHFNLSHSQDMALIGVTRLGPLGVDVERLREIADADALAQRFFTTGEVEAYRALPAGLRTRGFLNCWTRKESVVKATGAGLTMPLDAFEVSLDPRHPACLRRSPAAADGGFWSLHHVDPAPDYVGAVAVCSVVAPHLVLHRSYGNAAAGPA